MAEQKTFLSTTFLPCAQLLFLTRHKVLLEGRAAHVLDLLLRQQEAPGGGHQSLRLRRGVAHGLLAPGHGQVAQGLVLGLLVGAQALGQATCWQKGQMQ